MFTVNATGSFNKSTGMANVRVTRNLRRKVARVAAHTLSESLEDASSETCIPNASDSESAIATETMPPRTTPRELVAALRPDMRPKVVITPEVPPKLIARSKDFLTEEDTKREYSYLEMKIHITTK